MLVWFSGTALLTATSLLRGVLFSQTKVLCSFQFLGFYPSAPYQQRKLSRRSAQGQPSGWATIQGAVVGGVAPCGSTVASTAGVVSGTAPGWQGSTTLEAAQIFPCFLPMQEHGGGWKGGEGGDAQILLPTPPPKRSSMSP